jgi:hypothetical protein
MRAEAEVAAMEAKRATAALSVAYLPIELICKQGARIRAETPGPDATGSTTPVTIRRQALPHQSYVGCVGVAPPSHHQLPDPPAPVAIRSGPSTNGSRQRVVLQHGRHLRLSPRQLCGYVHRRLYKSITGPAHLRPSRRTHYGSR